MERWKGRRLVKSEKKSEGRGKSDKEGKRVLMMERKKIKCSSKWLKKKEDPRRLKEAVKRRRRRKRG